MNSPVVPPEFNQFSNYQLDNTVGLDGAVHLFVLEVVLISVLVVLHSPPQELGDVVPGDIRVNVCPLFPTQ